VQRLSGGYVPASVGSFVTLGIVFAFVVVLSKWGWLIAVIAFGGSLMLAMLGTVTLTLVRDGLRRAQDAGHGESGSSVSDKPSTMQMLPQNAVTLVPRVLVANTSRNIQARSGIASLLASRFRTTSPTGIASCTFRFPMGIYARAAKDEVSGLLDANVPSLGTVVRHLPERSATGRQ
jgi:hypothetical protein